jgi:hypothetical protein
MADRAEVPGGRAGVPRGRSAIVTGGANYRTNYPAKRCQNYAVNQFTQQGARSFEFPRTIDYTTVQRDRKSP